MIAPQLQSPFAADNSHRAVDAGFTKQLAQPRRGCLGYGQHALSLYLKVVAGADGRLHAIGKRLPMATVNAESIGLLRFMGEGRLAFLDAVDRIMVRREFGSAGDTLVVEERLDGWETSAHAFCDGNTGLMMPFATDYKRAQDGAGGLPRN